MIEQGTTKDQVSQGWVDKVMSQDGDDSPSADGAGCRLTEEDWMRRLRARLIERAGEGADGVADAVPYAEWRKGFEDDPEGAADEEMSYWDVP